VANPDWSAEGGEMGWRRRNVLGATVVVLALATAGCGGGGVDEADATATTVEPSTTSEPTPPPTTLTDEQAVLAAYQGYWDTWLVANDPPDPDHPDLARYATGAALERDREAISNHRLLRQVVRLPEGSRWRHEPTVESLSGDQAVVTDCSVDDSTLVDEPSGRVLNDEVASFRLRAVLTSSPDGWRVSASEVLEKWGGVAGCAA
jgi:hypothetical protein